MTEKKNALEQKQFIPKFVNELGLPTHFVNVVNVRAGAEEFFLTFGTALPVEVKNIEELKLIDTIDAQPLFRCAITRGVMRQVIDVMEAIYNQQTQQIEALRQLQEQEGEN